MILLKPIAECRPLGLLVIDERLSKYLDFRGQRRATLLKGPLNGLD